MSKAFENACGICMPEGNTNWTNQQLIVNSMYQKNIYVTSSGIYAGYNTI